MAQDAVPLLTRDGEVEIAKRIERGQLRVRQVLSRTPIMIKEIMSLGEGLKRDPNSIKDVIMGCVHITNSKKRKHRTGDRCGN